MWSRERGGVQLWSRAVCVGESGGGGECRGRKVLDVKGRIWMLNTKLGSLGPKLEVSGQHLDVKANIWMLRPTFGC